MTSIYDPIKALRAMLTEELRLNPNDLGVKLWMENGSVVIEGVVGRISEKKKALLFAMGLEGVSGVVDRLRVRPSARMSDDEIKDHVYDAFAGEQTLSDSGIKVEVADGVVDIEGQVGSLTHKRLAGVLAWWVPGSTDVINSLEVVPPEEDNDEEVNDALRIILEKDRLVDASSLKASTGHWVVTLEGVAGSDAEKAAAEDDAWYTWGVNWVKNNITVGAAKARKLP